MLFSLVWASLQNVFSCAANVYTFCTALLAACSFLAQPMSVLVLITGTYFTALDTCSPIKSVSSTYWSYRAANLSWYSAGCRVNIQYFNTHWLEKLTGALGSFFTPASILVTCWLIRVGDRINTSPVLQELMVSNNLSFSADTWEWSDY